MKIHEYQGKAILKELRRSGAARHRRPHAEEAEAAARELGTDVVVVKGADPRRRTRQRRRREAREIAGRSKGDRRRRYSA